MDNGKQKSYCGIIDDIVYGAVRVIFNSSAGVLAVLGAILGYIGAVLYALFVLALIAAVFYFIVFPILGFILGRILEFV